MAAVVLLCMYAATCTGYLPDVGKNLPVVDAAEWRGYISLAGCILMGYLSVKPSVEYTLSSVHTQLPVTLFLMGCTIAPLQVCTPKNLTVLALLAVGSYVLLHAYRNYQAAGSYFTAYLCVGLVSLIEPQLIWVAPLLLICCIPLHSLCVRTVAAGVMGLLCVCWVTFGLLYMTDQMAVAHDLVARLAHYDWSHYPLPHTAADAFTQLSPLLWILLLTIPGGIVILKNNTLNLRSRTCYYYCIALLGVLLLLCIVLPALYTTLLPLCLLLAAYIGIPLYAEANTRGKRIYAMVTLLVWIILITNPLWMRYIPF